MAILTDCVAIGDKVYCWDDARKLRIQARERKHGPIKDGEKVMA